MKENSNQTAASVLKGAWLLTIAGLIAKILSAIYRVPLQNLVGDTGFYVYQQVYPLYGIGMTFALSGLPNFVAKQIVSQPDLHSEQIFIRRYSILMIAFALICFSIVFFGAASIAGIMGDALLAPVIRSVSWMFLWMPILMILRGVLQGHQLIEAIAVSQVVEQLVRITVILIAAWQYSVLITTNSQLEDIYQMGANTMQSAWVAAMSASAVLVLAVMRNRRILVNQWTLSIPPKKMANQTVPFNLSWLNLIKAFAAEGLVICFFSSLLVFFQLIDSFTVYDTLTETGMTENMAKSVKGIYDRGQPLVQLGLVVATAFQMSYLPALSKMHIKKQEDKFIAIASQYFRVTLVLACLATAGMIAIMPQMNHLLFGNREGSLVLAHYVLLTIWGSAILSVHNILQAQGKWYYSSIGFTIGITAKIVLNDWLIPEFQTLGAAWATIIALMIAVTYLLRQMPAKLWHDIDIKQLIRDLGPLLILMVILVRLLAAFWSAWFGLSRLMDSLFIIPAIIGSCSLCLGWLKLKPIFKLKEWLDLPLGNIFIQHWFTEKNRKEI